MAAVSKLIRGQKVDPGTEHAAEYFGWRSPNIDCKQFESGQLSRIAVFPSNGSVPGADSPAAFLWVRSTMFVAGLLAKKALRIPQRFYSLASKLLSQYPLGPFQQLVAKSLASPGRFATCIEYGNNRYDFFIKLVVDRERETDG